MIQSASLWIKNTVSVLLPAGPLPVPPLPPILVPGLGLLPALKALDLLAPQLTPEEAVYLNQLLELTAALTGLSQSDLDNPPPARIIQLITSPTEQLRELQSALSAVASGDRSGGASPGTTGRPQVNQQVCLPTVVYMSYAHVYYLMLLLLCLNIQLLAYFRSYLRLLPLFWTSWPRASHRGLACRSTHCSRSCQTSNRHFNKVRRGSTGNRALLLQQQFHNIMIFMT